MNNVECKTILLVEDEAIISIVISKTLKRFGYNVINAPSGERALEIAVSNDKVSLILMDIELGSGMDGTAAAQKILEFRNIPIVFHTSHSEREMVERVQGITRYGYVIKSSGDFVLQSSIEMAFELFEAHRKVKASEEHFYGLFDRAPLGYQSLDEGGHFIEVNQKWLDTLGYSRDEVIGRWFGDFLLPEFADLFRERFPLFKSAGKIHSEFQMIHKNGNRRFIAFEGRIGYRENGRFQQTHCIISDITERKIAEEALEISKKRLLEAQNIARIGNWELDISTGQIWASDSTFELCGLIPSENNIIDQEKIVSLVKDREKLRNELENLINDDSLFNNEIEVNPADGGPSRVIHSIASCARDENGRPLRVAGVIQDITERRRADEMLKRSESLLRSTQKVTGIGSWEWDVEKQAMFWTEETYRIHDFEPGDLMLGAESIERSLECYRPEDRPLIFESYRKCIEEGKSYDLEFSFTTSKGRKLWIRTSAFPVIENGRIVKVTGFIMDKTAQKMSEEIIKEKNEELSVLNGELRGNILELEEKNEELAAAMEEMEAANAELIATNERLIEIEREVERSEEKFRMMFFQHHAIMFLIDPESGYIVEANSSAEKFYGYDTQQFRTMRIQDINILSPGEIEREMQFARDEQRNYFIFPHRLANSEIKTVEVYSSPVTINGNLLLFSVIHDITSRVKAEEKLLASEERYSKALAAVDDGIWEWSVTDGNAFFSDNYYKILGYNDSEFTASYDSWRMLVHPDDLDRVEDELKISVGDGLKFNIDLRMKMKSGEWLWVCTRGKTVESDRSGRALRMSGTLSDVTLRKKAELELRSSQGKLSSILENSSSLICEIDNNGIYTFVSKKYKDTLGYTPEELLGKPAAEKMHPDDLDSAAAKYDALKAEAGISVDEWRFMHKNGSYRYFECRGSAYIDSDGLPKTVVISYDITETKQVEDAQLFLIVGDQATGGEDFFQSLARYLAGTLGADFVCIDRLVGDGLRASTVAVYYDGRFEDNMEYALKDTPCGDVVGKTVCSFNQNVRGLFPEDIVLQEMNAESYAGVTLWGSSGEPVGLIAVISRKKMENPHLTESILKMVAIRAAGELERRDAEDRIRNLLLEKELLLKEVHHRIKNNMNTINGLLTIQADKVEDSAAVNVLIDARSRIESMMLLYDKLYRSDTFREVSVQTYLPVLIDEIIGNFPNRDIIKTVKHIEDFTLEMKTLAPLGIITNEIITNMMKHAFTGRDSGLITVSAAQTGNHVKISIHDNGTGIAESVDIDNSGGFGMQLIKLLTEQIDGTIRIERGGGTGFVLEFNV